ncbi:DegT/DnrJ/EryC1/StrS family aminotransferase [Tropicimonas sediminicola]|uniref:dTDP-4-amino-4,6-dideoxygalactose transaminase n=1 Tax=Tropicimonas sediminicola TaxID=1031541 RepID=A0A239LED0_9RHOB|nr:DegT/DnrJ/EryC1/StrS aminotransferase family protein [Tropicimonas sediminicola]SNT28685.1 dTDP-4-amino-4,6-dideoxygalactose transaminase [Tropicimonas sediminicola]
MLLVAEPVLGAEERDAVVEVLQGGWLTQGARVRAFELAFAERHGARDAVALANCTAALHLMLKALGIGPGDEVLVPSLTFAATVNSILYAGAEPVLVDVESLDSPLISIDDAASKVTARTRAVMLMHFAGHMAAPSPWQDFARRFNVMLLEDSAHAIGVAGVGSYGEAAAFSFYGNKNMTTAEGGMILMRDPELLARARQMRSHGMTHSVQQRLVARSPHYDVDMLGFNYRMDEIRAAIGLVQLSRLDQMAGRRAALVALYKERLQALASRHDGLIVPRPKSRISADHIMPIVLPARLDRDRVIAHLHAGGVQTTIHYPPVHTLSYYRARDGAVRLPVTEEFHRRELTLPLHPKMEDADVLRVVDLLESAFEESHALT